jgi:hypothetical protein
MASCFTYHWSRPHENVHPASVSIIDYFKKFEQHIDDIDCCLLFLVC